MALVGRVNKAMELFVIYSGQDDNSNGDIERHIHEPKPPMIRTEGFPLSVIL